MPSDAAARAGPSFDPGRANFEGPAAGIDILRTQRLAGAALVSPAVLAIMLVSVLPLLLAFGFSLTDFNLQIPANAATVVAILALIAGLSPRRRQSRTAAAPPGTESAQSTSPVPR